MNKIELKDKLIKKIEEIDDSEILEEIYSWLEDESQKKIYVTSEAQKEAIQEAQEQIKKGETISEKRANREIDKWLKGEE